MRTDHVDRIVSHWNRECPHLDVAAMGVVGRVRRLSTFMGWEMEKTWGEFDLNVAGFDVLSTLLRSGAPYRMSPGDLLASTMVTSGTMTHRIDQLERAGHVTRIANPEDGRSVLIALTDAGKALIETAVEAHVETQARLVAALSATERDELEGLLRKLLLAFERPDEADPVTVRRPERSSQVEEKP